jgi:NDP-sugar pyrophosphorylase family protein
MDYRAAAESWVTSRKAALMTVFRNDDAWDRSNVWFEDGILRKYSKAGSSAAMRHIDYGLSLFCADVFETYAESTPFDLATVQELLVTRGELAGFEVFERFYEIGSPEGLAELEAHLCQL